MIDVPAISMELLQHTAVGRRQLATMRLLLESSRPLGREQLIAAVQQQAGADCYGSRPEFTLSADIRALKDAGLAVHFSRAAIAGGYYVASESQLDASEARLLLRRIGWHQSDLVQIGLYAQMTPARKLELLFEWRSMQIAMLDARLRREHPDATPAELRTLRMAALDSIREAAPHV